MAFVSPVSHEYSRTDTKCRAASSAPSGVNWRAAGFNFGTVAFVSGCWRVPSSFITYPPDIRTRAD